MNIWTCVLLKNKISWANNNFQDLVQCRKHLIMTNSAVCYKMNTTICTCKNIIYHVNGSSDINWTWGVHIQITVKQPYPCAQAQCHLRCVQRVEVNMQYYIRSHCFDTNYWTKDCDKYTFFSVTYFQLHLEISTLVIPLVPTGSN
jgi:hypothetical protein